MSGNKIFTGAIIKDSYFPDIPGERAVAIYDKSNYEINYLQNNAQVFDISPNFIVTTVVHRIKLIPDDPDSKLAVLGKVQIYNHDAYLLWKLQPDLDTEGLMKLIPVISPDEKKIVIFMGIAGDPLVIDLEKIELR